MTDKKPPKPPELERASLVDRGWGPPEESRRSAPPPPSRASKPPPAPVRASQPPPPPSRASKPPMAPGRTSQPPPPPSGRVSQPPQPGRVSQPPPAPSRPSKPPPAPIRASQPPPAARVSEPPPPAARVSEPPPPAARASEPPPPSIPPPSIPPPSQAPSSLVPSDVLLPSLEQALRQRVRVGQGGGPLWAFLVITVVGSLALVMLVSAMFSTIVARVTTPRATGAPAALSALPSASAAASVSPAPPPTAPSSALSLLERAARGDADALAEIGKTPASERSPEQVTALAAGRAKEKQRALDALLDRARKEPAFASSTELAGALKVATADADTVRHALYVMAELPSSLGPDLLNWTFSNRRKGDPAAQLAAELLETSAVRKKASEALGVVLELRAAESCDVAKSVIVRVREHGDRRSLGPMKRFQSKRGCGQDGRDDCFACLREGDELKEAATAAAKRPSP